LFVAFLLGALIVTVFVWFSNARASSGVSGGDPDAVAAVDEEPTATVPSSEVNASNTESVTMTIPLEDGGVIDIDAPHMGLKIEKWSGDDVLVIVQKTKKVKSSGKSTPVDPVNIQVTRKGKNVRIEASGGAGWKESGMDLSFRIVLPDQYQADASMRREKLDTAARLTGVLWRTFHHDALEWLTR
jgi:hypothetical protein